MMIPLLDCAGSVRRLHELEIYFLLMVRMLLDGWTIAYYTLDIS